MEFVGCIICYCIYFSVQASFVLIAARAVGLRCAFKEAAFIAGICALLLFLPYAGFILSCVSFYFLFFRKLGASALQAIYAFLAFFMLNVLLVLFVQ